MEKIPVFYTPKMVAIYAPEKGKHFSPSSAKPIKVVESWAKQFPIEIIEPVPVTIEDYARAHDRQFVEDIIACKIENGFENKSPEVAAALPYTSGSLLSACKHVLKSKKVAVSPTSGFHHAEFNKSMGFCTLNGLMVTALALKESKLVNTVGILDLDMHYGNGTDNIIKVKKCKDWIAHFTGGKHFNYPEQVPKFFKELPNILELMSKCDIVIYQAGADPHINDPYGGWLTTEELRIRDAMVFDALAASRTPVAWNLAGGYQVEKDGSIPKVLEIHDNTMKECVRVYQKVA